MALLDIDLEARPAERGFQLQRRFDRTARLLGESGMERLHGARVLVFGLGGVGSYAAEALARSGVGQLLLCDFDSVCITNCNRQLPAMQGTIGKKKAELLAERVKLINPACDVQAVTEFYAEESSDRLLGGPVSYVLDCIDNVKAKLHLLHSCIERQLPVVSSMGAAGRLDPTQVRVADLCETWNDPFAKDVRKLLKRKYGVDTEKPTGISTVFSPERLINPTPLSYDHNGFLCVCPHKENGMHTCDHRTVINGTVGFVTGTFGLVAASVAVRRIAEGSAQPPARG
ncbi:ThiF family adenylyltransferase [Vulgatibacter sp.]|uniref:tRNA threonylcarbamoyladenosine dehydratase n=1 Tax=Vulgatibacter sp. TaxID=1971226 RepID=UPI0035616C8E